MLLNISRLIVAKSWRLVMHCCYMPSLTYKLIKSMTIGFDVCCHPVRTTSSFAVLL